MRHLGDIVVVGMILKCIGSLFTDNVTISDYIASNNGMINE
jgi:hypothetical protein